MESSDDKTPATAVARPVHADDEEGANIKVGVVKKRLQRLSGWLGRKDPVSPPLPPLSPDLSADAADESTEPRIVRRLSKRVVTELPRHATFRRQMSERREYLMPHHPGLIEPREFSVERRRAVSAPRSAAGDAPQLPELPSFASRLLSDEPGREAAPVRNVDDEPSLLDEKQEQQRRDRQRDDAVVVDDILDGLDRFDDGDYDDDDDDPPPPFTSSPSDAGWVSSDDVADAILDEELDRRWILNLSMHFRDKSDREKFFVTYAETPSRWRRLTVSCDYRNAGIDSLEGDLRGLRYQRDKSARIFEAIRDSLPDIQFFDTVTNLKLETDRDGRLHVHVTEDVNETITYPSASVIEGLDCPTFRESAVVFDSHLSGFVYKVKVDGEVLIKKEIPGPDAVDEFLYEVQALHTLKRLDYVISFRGVVVDDGDGEDGGRGQRIKGLLIAFAERGALVDILYDEKGRVSWPRRERWARQIVQGLSEIHEAGFVQGDLTLSNVVIDGNDDANIIDINRRGCPVGWEPPEMKPLIANRLKVGMFIGVKSDLFQLGMVLWALATQNDEPELQKRPLTLALAPRDRNRGSGDQNVEDAGEQVHPPAWFQLLVNVCLSERPQDRVSAKDLLVTFPPFERGHSPKGPASLSTAELRPYLLNGSIPFGTAVEANIDDDDDNDNDDDRTRVVGNRIAVMESSLASSQVLAAGQSHSMLSGPQRSYMDERDPDVVYVNSSCSTDAGFGPERDGVYIGAAPSVDTGYESSAAWIVPRGRKGRRDSGYQDVQHGFCCGGDQDDDSVYGYGHVAGDGADSARWPPDALNVPGEVIRGKFPDPGRSVDSSEDHLLARRDRDGKSFPDRRDRPLRSFSPDGRALEDCSEHNAGIIATWSDHLNRSAVSAEDHAVASGHPDGHAKDNHIGQSTNADDDHRETEIKDGPDLAVGDVNTCGHSDKDSAGRSTHGSFPRGHDGETSIGGLDSGLPDGHRDEGLRGTCSGPGVDNDPDQTTQRTGTANEDHTLGDSQRDELDDAVDRTDGPRMGNDRDKGLAQHDLQVKSSEPAPSLDTSNSCISDEIFHDVINDRPGDGPISDGEQAADGEGDVRIKCDDGSQCVSTSDPAFRDPPEVLSLEKTSGDDLPGSEIAGKDDTTAAMPAPRDAPVEDRRRDQGLGSKRDTHTDAGFVTHGTSQGVCEPAATGSERITAESNTDSGEFDATLKPRGIEDNRLSPASPRSE